MKKILIIAIILSLAINIAYSRLFTRKLVKEQEEKQNF